MSQLPLFDAHFHVVDPAFPLVANSGYLPEPFTIDDYRDRTRSLQEIGLDVVGGAVVSGSFQAFDQSYLVAALARLGDGFVGVTQLPATVTDSEIVDLDRAGVRAVRFNLVRGGSAGLDELERIARRVHDLAGWHAEFYLDARTLDDDLSSRITALPAASIDHLGMHRDGVAALLRLVERGVKVKVDGFGRVDLDPAQLIAQIVAIDPTALMVGTDLPSTRARRPFADDDLILIRDAVGPELCQQVFWGNAAAFYRLSSASD